MSQLEQVYEPIGLRPDYFIQVQKVSISEGYWKKTRLSLRGAPSLYVTLKYGKEKVKTRTVNNSFSPNFDDKQLVVRPSPPDNGTIIKIVVMHDSISQVDTTIGQLEITLEDLRLKTIDGKVSLDLESSHGPSPGTINIHCEPLDYKAIAARTGEEVNRNAITTSHLIEVTGDISSLVAEQSDLYISIGNLVMKLGTFVKVVDRLSEIHPYSDAAWRIAKSFFDAVAKQLKADAEVVDLVDDMSFTVDCVLEINGVKDKFERLELVIIQILQQITECCTFIREYMGHGFFERMTLIEGYEKIKLFRDVLGTLKNRLDMAMTTNTALVVARMSKKIDIIYIKGQLDPKEYYTKAKTKRAPGTCTEAISNITSLLMSASDSNIVWLFGSSGCGKSMLSHALAEYFRGIKRLGAYLHFCHETEPSPESIIPTIAYQLASFDSTIGSNISDCAQPYHKGLLIETQFKELLLQPLTEAAQAMRGPVIIILDGVDDCGPIESRRDFLRIFSSGLFSKLPRNFRFLITSQWDRDISRSLLSSPNSVHHVHLYSAGDSTDAASHIANEINLLKTLFGDRECNYNLHFYESPTSHQNGLPQLDYIYTVWHLGAMNADLKSIIASRKSMHALNEKIPDLDVILDKEILPSMREACLSWSCALALSPFSKKLHTSLSQFAYEKLLIWIEVMSLLGEYSSVGPALIEAISWISNHDGRLVIFLQDAYDNVTKYAECISQCAVQVYRTMLQIEKGYSAVADHYQSNVISPLEIEEIGHLPLVGHSFLLDDTRGVSGSDYETVRIWIAKDVMILSTLEGRIDRVTSVSLSPACPRTVSVSDGNTIRIWNSVNGQYLFGLVVNTDRVKSTISIHDGTRIISGSGDRTVRIWDTNNRLLLLFTLVRHTDCVNSVSFSPIDTRVVSGSENSIVKIWNAKDGKLLFSLEGRRNWATSISFSLDETRVVSGSGDKTVSIWDVDRRNPPSEEHRLTKQSLTNTQFISDPSSQGISESEWKLGDDGWVQVKGNDHAFWIPEYLRPHVCKPTDDITSLVKRSGYCMVLRVRD